MFELVLTMVLMVGVQNSPPSPSPPSQASLSINYPPRTLPKDTMLILLDSHHRMVWKSGQSVKAETIAEAAYLRFQMPRLSYTYPIAENPHTLSNLVVWIGTRQISLRTLLHNRGYVLNSQGYLGAVQ